MERHYFAAMNGSGDTRVEWDLSNPASVAQAREVIERYMHSGGSVFRASPNGEGGERMREFDPHADMIGSKPVVGG